MEPSDVDLAVFSVSIRLSSPLQPPRWSLKCSNDCQGRSALHLMANSITRINSFAMVFMLDNQFDVPD